MPMRLRVRDAFSHQILHAPSDVVLHLRAPLGVARVQEFFAEAGGAAKIRHENRIAAIGEKLGESRCSPTHRAPKDRRAPPLAPAALWLPRLSAASSTRGFPGRRTTGSGPPASAPAIRAAVSRGSCIETRARASVRSNRYVSPGSVSPCAPISHRFSSRVLERTEISLPGNFCFEPLDNRPRRPGP